MRSIRVITMITALVASGLVMGQTPQIDVAHELPSRAFELPSGTAGLLKVTACDACPTKTFRITEDTVFTINANPVAIDVLRRELAKHDTVVLLVLTPDRLHVKRIMLPLDVAQ